MNNNNINLILIQDVDKRINRNGYDFNTLLITYKDEIEYIRTNTLSIKKPYVPDYSFVRVYLPQVLFGKTEDSRDLITLYQLHNSYERYFGCDCRKINHPDELAEYIIAIQQSIESKTSVKIYSKAKEFIREAFTMWFYNLQNG